MCCNYAVTSNSPQVKTQSDIVRPPSLWIYLHQMPKNSIECILEQASYIIVTRQKVIQPSFWIFLHSIQKNSFERHMYLAPQARYVVTHSFQTCIIDKYPMVVAFLFRIDCVDCSILFSCKERVPVMSSTRTHLSSICLIYDTTLARSLHGLKCPLPFYQDRDHVRGLLLFDVLLPQKDDVVWRGRS